MNNINIWLLFLVFCRVRSLRLSYLSPATACRAKELKINLLTDFNFDQHSIFYLKSYLYLSNPGGCQLHLDMQSWASCRRAWIQRTYVGIFLQSPRTWTLIYHVMVRIIGTFIYHCLVYYLGKMPFWHSHKWTPYAGPDWYTLHNNHPWEYLQDWMEI